MSKQSTLTQQQQTWLSMTNRKKPLDIILYTYAEKSLKFHSEDLPNLTKAQQKAIIMEIWLKETEKRTTATKHMATGQRSTQDQ